MAGSSALHVVLELHNTSYYTRLQRHNPEAYLTLIQVLQIYNSIAAAAGCGYAEWGNPERLNSFFPGRFWPHQDIKHFREHPLEGEKMPRLFGKAHAAHWLYADTLINLGLIRDALQKAFKASGISERQPPKATGGNPHKRLKRPSGGRAGDGSI